MASGSQRMDEMAGIAEDNVRRVSPNKSDFNPYSVRGQMESMEEEIGALHEDISILENAINMVLTPESDDGSEKGPINPSPPHSQATEGLRHFNERINSARARLQGIRDRVNLS